MDNKLTPEQYAQAVAKAKPHLIKIEEVAAEIEYGFFEVRFEVRAGVVNKMTFFKGETWLREKDQEPLTNQSDHTNNTRK